MSNELVRTEEIVNIIANRISVTKRFDPSNANVRIPIEVAEELVDILSDSIRTLKDYQVFDHSLPLPPRRLN